MDLFIVISFLFFASFLFLWAIYDFFKKIFFEKRSDVEFYWLFIIIFFPIIGSIIYFQFQGRSRTFSIKREQRVLR